MSESKNPQYLELTDDELDMVAGGINTVGGANGATDPYNVERFCKECGMNRMFRQQSGGRGMGTCGHQIML